MGLTVINRNGEQEDVRFDAILEKLNRLAMGLDTDWVDTALVAKRVIEGLYDGVTTRELDGLVMETAATMNGDHPDYSILAARICVDDLHRSTSDRFSEVIRHLHDYVDPETGLPAPLISEDVLAVVEANAERLDDAVVYERDLNYDYFGFKTLERSYLLKTNGEIAERPQHMLMRVAVGIHGADIDRALKTYDLMSQGWFTHATPTLFNSGTPAPQMSSCFLLTMQDDSLDGIYDTLKQSAMISKSAGGIGLSVHNIRAKGSYIKGTNGTSNGLVPMLRVFNDTARYVDQGGGKRKGSIAIYLEPWHPDIFEFLDLRKNHGKEESRARDLFYALWTPDLFMRRVQDDGEWSLFCPNECPGLHDVHSEAFVELYNRYESEGRARRTVKARELWDAIVTSQIETGTPYMLYKDVMNAKSNQQNLGTIRSSNLCTEIIEYTSEDEVAVCNLASIALPKFVDMDTGSFDHQALYEVVYHVTGNLNEVIDRNYYPVVEARNSNMRHRPVGLGVQGLADTFALLRMPFESEAAGVLNRDIFETIYFAKHAPHRRISPSRRDPTPHSRAVQRARGSCNSTSGVSRNIPDVGIGTASRRRSSNMDAELVARRTDANCVHKPDPREQRVLRTLHIEPLSAQDLVRGVRGAQQAPRARPHRSRALGEGDQGSDPPPQGIHPGDRDHPGEHQGPVQDDLGDQATTRPRDGR